MTGELGAQQKKISKWYFGGLAGAGAASITHPLDLIKANLQTQKEKLPIIRFTGKIVREQGFLSLYSGISASILRQMTYSLTRFGLYEFGKDFISTETFGGKLLLAGLSGMAGGYVGTPADMVNVRMQNDVKLPKDQRRNYKNAIDGLMRVYSEEGFKRLFSGASTATIRGVLMTVGQIAFYDQTKQFLLNTPYFQDNLNTHFTASLFAASMATVLTQPIDVLKTRAMNAKAGQYNGLLDIYKHTYREGPSAFFKGFVPAFIRLGPHTILMFVILEQLRLNFGVIV